MGAPLLCLLGVSNKPVEEEEEAEGAMMMMMMMQEAMKVKDQQGHVEEEAVEAEEEEKGEEAAAAKGEQLGETLVNPDGSDSDPEPDIARHPRQWQHWVRRRERARAMDFLDQQINQLQQHEPQPQAPRDIKTPDINPFKEDP